MNTVELIHLQPIYGMIEKLKTHEFILLNKRNLISTQKLFNLF